MRLSDFQTCASPHAVQVPRDHGALHVKTCGRLWENGGTAQRRDHEDHASLQALPCHPSLRGGVVAEVIALLLRHRALLSRDGCLEFVVVWSNRPGRPVVNHHEPPPPVTVPLQPLKS